jgi:hypothetical protein
MRGVVMAEINVLDGNGQFGFRLQKYVWRSKPTASPLTGRSVRCVVGQDEHGKFRAATRVGRDNERGDIQTTFATESFSNKEEAIAASRDITRDYLNGEAQGYANTVTRAMKPGEQIVKVEMDDGWSTQINAPGKLDPVESRVQKIFNQMGEGKKPRKEGPKESRVRDRYIDR